MHVAQRFERFLDTYRRPDGSRWTRQNLDEATGGVVPRSYFTNLRKGRIENPGYDKMLAIARAIGFPPALWFEDAPTGGTMRSLGQGQGQALAARSRASSGRSGTRARASHTRTLRRPA